MQLNESLIAQLVRKLAPILQTDILQIEALQILTTRSLIHHQNRHHFRRRKRCAAVSDAPAAEQTLFPNRFKDLIKIVKFTKNGYNIHDGKLLSNKIVLNKSNLKFSISFIPN